MDCSPSSARSLTTSGPAPTSKSTATPRYSRQCASPCFMCSRRRPGARSGRSRRRDSPGLATPGTRSVIPRCTCFPCSTRPHRTPPPALSAIADDNVYTTLMARRSLLAAADVAARYPDRARELGVDAEEAAGWRDAATAMHIPYDEMLGVHAQADKFTRYQAWDFASTRPDQYPLLLHFTYFDLYRKQVVKQADLVLAMFTCSNAFTAEQKLRNFDYYEAITVRDSSLSACIQAIMATEVGHLDLAYDYLGEAALMDLYDLEHNTRDGVHIASLAGAWLVLVCGFGGMRHEDGEVTFAPRLPD